MKTVSTSAAERVEKECLEKDLAVAKATSVSYVKELELMRAEMAVLRKELAVERAKNAHLAE